MGSWYVDSSALVKLVRDEPFSAEMERFAKVEAGGLVASGLVVTEVLRAVRRWAPASIGRAEEVLLTMEIVSLSGSAYRAAGRLDPLALRSLDALHLQAALDLEDELQALVTYDDRLAEAAHQHAIRTVSPGR
ncbi:MAG: type II toxin-antitoxin system VapC family toxin [Thermoleophilia bacterium]|jgi:predicted nucleic acid-binding protein|nr:type II toxin-antitoxin system VapC family toxin [Thermoleophilia bacterium]